MWVKICGIRDLKTAREVCASGADAIGLNFYTSSPRSVSVQVAQEIVSSLPPAVTPVGLFVNHELSDVLEIARSCGLKTLQLHGDETPEYLSHLQGFDLIRAFRIGDGDFQIVDRYLEECRRVGVSMWGCLIDACVQGNYGGTGQMADWKGVRSASKTSWPRLILAGGLTPENVTDGIDQVSPWGVDTASGVESAPGIKDPVLVEAFVRRARQTPGS